MIETASHLVDHVLPQVPIRQWVLSFPWPLRVLFAARPEVLTQVLNVVTRALSSAVVRRAGQTLSAGGQTGIVTFIQRFGSALNLNIHLHMLVPDGAYTFAHGQARFHRAPAPTDIELERLLETLIRRITRTLVRAGVLVEDPQSPWLDLDLDSDGDNSLEQLANAAVRLRIAVGIAIGLLIPASWYVTGVLSFDEFELVRLESLTFTAPVGNAIQYLLNLTGSQADFGIVVSAYVLLLR